ncbi:MAG: undecaprenyl-diphosphate phosphatase [Candidatus Sericytochromatia bacterium]|nr:undecaprenyl-diphosphate phosphatase [Candidatus Sericytochromatia bacterium]
MRFYQAAILGAIQGLTEFLPVSSTAHLIAVPRLLGWKRPGLSFDTSLHLGTLLAAGIYLRKDLRNVLASLRGAPGQNEAWQLLWGNIPAGLAGLLLDKPVEKHLRSPAYMSAGMVLGALLMAWADQQADTSENRDVQHGARFFGPHFFLAASQALALFPGMSRSGMTMATGLATGLSRTEAARQSFLAGFPMIAAAGLFKLKDLFKEPPSQREMALLATALATATVSGYLSLRLLFTFLERHSLQPFVWYRLGLALYLWAQKNQPEASD